MTILHSILMLRIGVSASDNRNPEEMSGMPSTHPFDENGDSSSNTGKEQQINHPEPATCNDPQVAHPEASQTRAVHSKSLSDTSLQTSPSIPSLKRIIPNASAKHPPIQAASQTLSEQSWLYIGKMDVLIMIVVAKMALAMRDARRAICALELALKACRNSCGSPRSPWSSFASTRSLHSSNRSVSYFDRFGSNGCR